MSEEMQKCPHSPIAVVVLDETVYVLTIMGVEVFYAANKKTTDKKAAEINARHEGRETR